MLSLRGETFGVSLPARVPMRQCSTGLETCVVEATAGGVYRLISGGVAAARPAWRTDAAAWLERLAQRTPAL